MGKVQLLQSLFNWKRLLKFITQYIVVTLIIIAGSFFILTSLFHSAWSRYETTITTGNEFRTISLSNLCLVLQCEGVVVKTEEGEKRYFERKDNKLLPKFDKDLADYATIYNSFTKNGRITLSGDGYRLYINSDIIMDLLLDSLYLIIGVTIIPYTFISVYFYLKRRKKEILANRELKNNMELSLQRNITEMIHHELNAPIALLTSQVDELYFKKFGIRHEVKFEPITEAEKEAYPLYENIYFSLDRINSVLTTLARSKHIKFNNGTVPLLLIVKNMESSVNAFKLEKIKVRILNSDILQTHSVIKSLGNGPMMNILHILFTNAIEAYSNIIEITSEMIGKSKLVMYIKDNGCGIKNSKGEFVADDRVFRNGYSTKLEPGENQGFWSTLFGSDNNIESSDRGIGLFMVRNLLTSNGGDICVYSTSEEGTTFKLTIPVKDTIYRH